MTKVNIMTDLETLGINEGSTIFQIAAASFDLTTGEIHDEIDLKLDISKADLKVDGSTLRWWLQTDAELLAKLIAEGEYEEKEMFELFIEWVKGYESPRLWGNGILFDNAKIQSKCNDLGLDYPIYYQHDRDVRTILELASMKSGLSEQAIRDKVKRADESAHDAIDDVRQQIRLVHYCYQIINE